MNITGNDIAACARKWIGTRFHHQGRLQKTHHHKGGVDCLGLLVGVAAELQLRDKNGELLYRADNTEYSHTPDTDKLRNGFANLLHEVAMQEMQEGDIALCNIDNSPQHLAIISVYEEGYGLIHAYAQARKVVEHALDEYWRAKICAVFRVR